MSPLRSVDDGKGRARREGGKVGEKGGGQDGRGERRRGIIKSVLLVEDESELVRREQGGVKKRSWCTRCVVKNPSPGFYLSFQVNVVCVRGEWLDLPWFSR